MANKLINELTAVSVVTNLDEVEVQKAGEYTTKRATVLQLNAQEAAARVAQDDIIEGAVGLSTLGTYPSLTNSWYLRAAEFAAGVTDRGGATGALTENVLNAIRILDAQINTLSGLVGSNIYTKEVICSTSDILACNATPKVLLQAFTGRYFEVISAVGFNKFGTSAFDAGTDKLQIKYWGAGPVISEFDNAFLEAGADAVYRAIPTSNGAMPNATVGLYCPTPPTSGDGEIIIYLTYRIHEL